MGISTTLEKWKLDRIPGFNLSSWREEMTQGIINKWGSLEMSELMEQSHLMHFPSVLLKIKPFGFESKFLWALPDSISIYTWINCWFIWETSLKAELLQGGKGTEMKLRRISNIFSTKPFSAEPHTKPGNRSCNNKEQEFRISRMVWAGRALELISLQPPAWFFFSWEGKKSQRAQLCVQNFLFFYRNMEQAKLCWWIFGIHSGEMTPIQKAPSQSSLEPFY